MIPATPPGTDLGSMHAAPPFAITHEPGHMLLTDVLDLDYRIA